jgi:hypothetical protein
MDILKSIAALDTKLSEKSSPRWNADRTQRNTILESILTDAAHLRFRLKLDEGNGAAMWTVLGFPTESKLQSPIRNIEGSRVHPP